MGPIFTIVALVLVCVYFLGKMARANHEVVKRERQEVRELEKRGEQEKELLGRLERVKKKTGGLESAKSAVQSDPKRAAKVVSKMMKEKK